MAGLTEQSGRTVNYGYDNLYRLTSETIASDSSGINGNVSYTYDPVGNRTQKVSTLPGYPGGLSNYNANDQLSTDTYDANGNTTASGQTGYVYDFENHLISANGITYVYDGDGHRISKTVNGTTTSYATTDINPTGYSQLVGETYSGNINVFGSEHEHTYFYGLDAVLELRDHFVNQGVFEQQMYFVHDGHGSVRAITGQNGAVTDTYDYDAFGVLIHQTGTTPNTTLYSGEQFDPDLNLYFNRARYLNVSTGRFWSMDTYEGDVNSPASLHKYVYVSADPLNRVDPSGQADADAATNTFSFGVQTILATMALIAAVAAVCSIDYQLGRDDCFDRYPKDKTFYHGTSGYAAESIVAEQKVDPVALVALGSQGSDYGFGFYMTDTLVTATTFANYRGNNGKGGGPAVVRIDISKSDWNMLVLEGAIDLSSMSRFFGSQAFVPIYLIDEFNRRKRRFSLIELPPNPGFR